MARRRDNGQRLRKSFSIIGKSHPKRAITTTVGECRRRDRGAATLTGMRRQGFRVIANNHKVYALSSGGRHRRESAIERGASALPPCRGRVGRKLSDSHPEIPDPVNPDGYRDCVRTPKATLRKIEGHPLNFPPALSRLQNSVNPHEID